MLPIGPDGDYARSKDRANWIAEGNFSHSQLRNVVEEDEDRVSSFPGFCILGVLDVGECVLVVLWMFLSPKVLQMPGFLDPTEGLGVQCSGDPTPSGGLEWERP